MKILVTSFEAFGGDGENASREALDALPDRIGGAEIVKLCLPTVFGASAAAAIEAVRRVRPDAVVCLGQAGGRDAVTPERTAVNVMDASAPDNEGYRPEDVPIEPDGPAAYFSTLPIKEMAAAMRQAGVPARISDSAGTYVCNSLMYAVLHYASRNCPAVPCGFIHVPYMDTQKRDGVPALPKDEIVRGLTAALRILAPGA